MLGPKRSIPGCGDPVPRRVTVNTCADVGPARATVASTSKRLLHHERLLVARFIGRRAVEAAHEALKGESILSMILVR
jgi:hypothetical protein